jgi:hypothetical protein
MSLDDLRANPIRTMLSPLPTPVIMRLYRRWSRAEDGMRALTLEQRAAIYGGEGPASDAYDKVADRAAAASWILRERGLDVCLYCNTTDGSHRRGVDCPATLLDRLGISW